MSRWALVFLLLAVVSAAIGFSGYAGEFSWLAKVLALACLAGAAALFFAGRSGS